MEAVVRSLVDYMKTLPVIDAHSHLADEREMLEEKPDVFTRIFTHYSLTSAETSGLVKRERMRDTGVPLEVRWKEFKPCLEAIRDCGYVRAAIRTASEYYGVEDIHDGTIGTLQSRIEADCTPGQYERVMNFCRIETVINQHTYREPTRSVEVSREFMCLLSSDMFRTQLPGLYRALAAEGRAVSSLESFFNSWFESVAAKTRLRGVKLVSCFPYAENRPEAAEQYRKSAVSAHNRMSDAQAEAVCTWLRHRIIEECGRRNIPVAVHCGINWNCATHPGGTFYNNDPRYIMPWAVRYPNTVFDLYHAGIPWVREIAVIANQCPNVVLNLVWAYQISPDMTAGFLSEWFDLVPVNKLIGFGGDSTTPEKTVGALSLARECIARALAARAAGHGMSLSRAADICRVMLYDNPKRIYGLDAAESKSEI